MTEADWKTIADIPPHFAQLQGAKTAFSFEGRDTTFQAFDDHTNQVANALIASGVKKAVIASGAATLSTNTNQTAAAISGGGAITLRSSTGADLSISGKADALKALGLTTATGSGNANLNANRVSQSGNLASLISDGEVVQTGERVRPGAMPWEPPAAALAALQKLEGMLEADGFQVPENAAWQKALGAGAADAAGLGFFLGRLVRVNAELTYTVGQMSRLQKLIADWFNGGHAALTVADFRGISGASRKYGVPLLEHCDRVGWTVRVGDERRKG